MKHLFTTLTAVLVGFISQAQVQTGKIFGSVKEVTSKTTVEAVTVSLLRAADSSLIKTSLTDTRGDYTFENVKLGDYLVKVGSVNHNNSYSNTITISAEKAAINAGVLELVPVNKNLKEVVVNSKKLMIERKIDRTVVNVDAFISNEGSTAMEVLEKSPGVTVDKDGNISLKGKPGVMIMLDGKPSYLSGAELANLLRSMPSNNLDQIEIMTNPSAKYDAAGNSGIINIKTKKNKQKGFN